MTSSSLQRAGFTTDVSDRLAGLKTSGDVRPVLKCTLRERVRRGALALLILLASTSVFAERVRVTAERASVWVTTAGTGRLIGVVRRGEVLEVQGYEDRWLLVALPADPTQNGYILEQQTELVNDSPTPASAAGAAQRRPPQRAPARRRVPKPPPFLYLGITGQASPLDFTNSDSVTTLLESETRATRYKPSRLPGFEVTIGREMRRNLIVSGTLVETIGPGKASISAQIPHPIFYATPRSLAGTTTAGRTETAIHLQFAKIVHRSAKSQLTVGAGPSVFLVNQALLDQLKYDDVYPFDSVTFTGAALTGKPIVAAGANVQVDFTKPINRKVSWQITGRFSYGQVKPSVHGTTAKLPAGGGQVSGGIRVVF